MRLPSACLALIAGATPLQAQYTAGHSPEECEGAQVRAICGTPGLPPDDYKTAPHVNYGVNNPSFTFFRIEGEKCLRTTYGTSCRAVCSFPKSYCVPPAVPPLPPKTKLRAR